MSNALIFVDRSEASFVVCKQRIAENQGITRV
jgi:hypothetical protein